MFKWRFLAFARGCLKDRDRDRDQDQDPHPAPSQHRSRRSPLPEAAVRLRCRCGAQLFRPAQRCPRLRPALPAARSSRLISAPGAGGAGGGGHAASAGCPPLPPTPALAAVLDSLKKTVFLLIYKTFPPSPPAFSHPVSFHSGTASVSAAMQLCCCFCKECA